jgi:NADH dehydrogenase FAD-containing subunit
MRGTIMNRPQTAILAGAGHAHLHVAARAESFVQHGARVVLIEPAEFWYSGLASGMLGGMYEPADDRLDPRTLIEAHGGEFVRGRVESIDTDARRLRLADGTELAYDLLSIDVGSRVNPDAIRGQDRPPVPGLRERTCFRGAKDDIWSPPKSCKFSSTSPSDDRRGYSYLSCEEHHA